MTPKEEAAKIRQALEHYLPVTEQGDLAALFVIRVAAEAHAYQLEEEE